MKLLSYFINHFNLIRHNPPNRQNITLRFSAMQYGRGLINAYSSNIMIIIHYHKAFQCIVTVVISTSVTVILEENFCAQVVRNSSLMHTS